MLNIIAQYFGLCNIIDRVWAILKGCAIYCVIFKNLKIYCANGIILCRLLAILRNILSVSLQRSCEVFVSLLNHAYHGWQESRKRIHCWIYWGVLWSSRPVGCEMQRLYKLCQKGGAVRCADRKVPWKISGCWETRSSKKSKFFHNVNMLTLWSSGRDWLFAQCGCMSVLTIAQYIAQSSISPPYGTIFCTNQNIIQWYWPSRGHRQNIVQPTLRNNIECLGAA